MLFSFMFKVLCLVFRFSVWQVGVKSGLRLSLISSCGEGMFRAPAFCQLRSSPYPWDRMAAWDEEACIAHDVPQTLLTRLCYPCCPRMLSICCLFNVPLQSLRQKDLALGVPLDRSRIGHSALNLGESSRVFANMSQETFRRTDWNDPKDESYVVLWVRRSYRLTGRQEVIG